MANLDDDGHTRTKGNDLSADVERNVKRYIVSSHLVNCLRRFDMTWIVVTFHISM